MVLLYASLALMVGLSAAITLYAIRLQKQNQQDGSV